LYNLISKHKTNLKQIKHEKLISSLIIASILVISIIYLEIYVQDDYKLEKERYEISKFLVENTNGVNWSSHTKYFKAAKIENDWPSIPPPNDSGHIFLKMKKFGYDEFSTLIDFIKKNEEKGLTHLTVEDMQDWQTFPDLYNNSEEYPFLEQIYDSKKNQLISKVKIFRINYEVFHQFFV